MWLDTTCGYERLQERLKGEDFPRSRLFWPLEPDKPEEGFPSVDLRDDRWRELVAAIVDQERPAWVIIDGLGDLHAEVLLGDRIFAVMAAVAHEACCAVTFVVDQKGRLPAKGSTTGWAVAMRRLRTIVSVSPWAPDSIDLRLRVARTDGERPAPL